MQRTLTGRTALLLCLLAGCSDDPGAAANDAAVLDQGALPDAGAGGDALAAEAGSDALTPDAGPPLCPRGQGWTADRAGCSPFEDEAIVDEPVVFANGAQQLSGTVTKPDTDRIARFPAAILIHGSGPKDRDESADGALGFTFGKEVYPFRDIAEHLARHGYLVLRYDKRTCVTYNSDHCTATSITDLDTLTIDTFVADASKGLDYLKSRPDVRADDLIVLGHSQGGPMALDLGRARADIKSVVLLAGPALSLRETMVDQYEQVLAWLREEPASPTVDEQIAAAQAERDRYDQALAQIEAGTYAESTFDGEPVPFWQSWIDSQGRVEDNAEQLRQPLAVVSGTEDYNVPPKHSAQLQAWRGEREGDFFRVYEGLTHALVTYHTFPPAIEDTVDARLLDDLVTWLDAQPAP